MLLSTTKILAMLFLKMTFDKLVQRDNVALQGTFRPLNMKPKKKVRDITAQLRLNLTHIC